MMCPVLELPQKPQSLASTQQQSCGPLCQSKHKKECLKLRVHACRDRKKKLNSSLSHIFLAWGHFFPILANDFVYRGSETVFLHLLFYKLVKLFYLQEQRARVFIQIVTELVQLHFFAALISYNNVMSKWPLL